MEVLAKAVQQAQAAVLAVQDDLALLRTQLEEDNTAAPTDDNTSGVNPYYVELQTSIQQKQETAAQLLQSSTHIFYEQFGALEEKAARLENVRQKEKELQAAKKSMQRYFDAHAKELAEVSDTYNGLIRLEQEKRQHLESAAVELRQCQQRQQLAHHVLHVWMKKAMIRNLTREYVTRQSATRQTYQAVACEAVVQQRQAVSQQRLFYMWRSRWHARQLRRVEASAAESERRSQFFRQELATTQQALHDRLGAALEQRQHVNVDEPRKVTASPSSSKAAVAVTHDDEVQRLRTALEEMTLEFSERTGTYIRQQEHLEQLFWSKEQKLQESIVGLQTHLSEEQHARQTYATQQQAFVERVHAYWNRQHLDWVAAMQRKEEFAHFTLLGLVGRLRHRHRDLQDEATKLASEVHTLAPLSERCVQLENQLAVAQQLLQKTKSESHAAGQRTKADALVIELLTDRVARAQSAALRMRFFAQWLQRNRSQALTQAQAESGEVRAALQQQHQRLLLQQQESAARHTAEVAALRDESAQLRRANARLQSELAAAANAQRENDVACSDAEVKNGELAAALLRETMERRGEREKWQCGRVDNLILTEAQARCRVETQEFRWWSALQLRENAALKVWSAGLHYDAAQLTAVCDGWEGHCHRLESTHNERQRAAASRQAGALERAHLQTQTLWWWTAWRGVAHERRAVRAVEAAATAARNEQLERHGNELARLHARHDAALRHQQQELTLEKTQLQSIHQQRSDTQRRVHAQEQSELAEQHRQQLAELQASHTDAIDVQTDAVRQLQGQLADLGSVVVEYCAAATFAQWRSWAMERRAQRSQRQRHGFLMRVQAWHRATTQAQEDALLMKEALFADTVARAAERHHDAVHRHTQRLAQESEVRAAQQRKAEQAAEAARREAAHLRSELQHTRGLYEAERRDGEALQHTTAEERRDHHTTLSLARRLGEWHAASGRAAWEQQRAMGRVFEDAVAAVLCDVGIDALALRETYVDCVTEHRATHQLLQQTTTAKVQLETAYEKLEKSYAEMSKEVALLTETLAALVTEHETVHGGLVNAQVEKKAAEDAHTALARELDATRTELAELRAEASEVQNAFSAFVKEHEKQRVEAAVQTTPATPPAAASANSSLNVDFLEVSALNAEEQQQQQQQLLEHTHETRSALAVVAARSDSATVSVLEAPLQVLPTELWQRLRLLETCAAGSDAVRSTEATDRLGELLQEPFVPSTPTSSPSVLASSFSADAVAPAAVTPVVCRLLETLRVAAVRWAEEQTQRYIVRAATLDSQRAQSEAALTQLRENMAGLLEEQRSLAGEIEDELQHQPEAESETPNKSLRLPQVLQERLDALTTRYARVLDAFYGDITRRQDTFYSVNGMLVEVDQFSEVLLQRFEDNVHEMARLQHQLDGVSGVAATSPHTPVSRHLSDEDISVVSPAPRQPQCPDALSLVRVLCNAAPATITATKPSSPPPPSPLSSAPPPSASDLSTPSVVSDHASASVDRTSPERRALRERVHLLERLLVEAKVQVAEASAMMDSSHRAASLAAPPSFQVRAWAALDAADFADLAVTEADFLQLYAAAESATHSLVTALRSSAARLRETQGEMSQQLQTACLSVEASVQQRYQAEVARYEATVRGCNEALAEATRQQGREKQRYEELLAQQSAESAAAATKYTRDMQSVRQNYTAEIDELTDHLNLLEAELERTRQATQSAVTDAVTRQAELLAVEHEQRLRGAEKKLTRLMAEKVLLEERLTAAAQDGARRLQQEREAVARLQQQLTDAEAGNADVAAPAPHAVDGAAAELSDGANRGWATYVSNTADLYVAQYAAMTEWFTACVEELLDQEREEWETEVMQLRERVASMLEKPPSALSVGQEKTDEGDASTERSISQHGGSTSSDATAKQTVPTDIVEDTSSQALTLSPSPQRATTTVATRLSKSAVCAQSPLPSLHSMHRRTSPRTEDAMTARGGDGVSAEQPSHRCASAGTSPTRCRSPSLDSLELSQSFLRYAKMLSDQRTRNAERLERANALTAEVDDLLLRGVELTHIADKPEPC